MKNSLSKSQIEILKNKGTEPAFSGDLLYNDDNGEYRCVGCLSLIHISEPTRPY